MNDLTDNQKRDVLIGIGSNVNPEQNIIAALKLLDKLTSLKHIATIWQTPAVGSEGQDYLNTAVLVETNLTPNQFKLEILTSIETDLGRTRSGNKYADRTIDLDILVYDNALIDDELWTQAHITIPAAEILPDLIEPTTGESLSQAANRILPGINFTERNDLV